MVASILSRALESEGLRATLVGGSAIEVHAPGIYKSGDMDFVIEGSGEVRDKAAKVFRDLGFEPSGRHWKRGDLFVEIPSHDLVGPSELVRVGSFPFRVASKEALLAARITGFKHWPNAISFGQQAIDMIAAFGQDLKEDLLQRLLAQEDAQDAYRELVVIARGDSPVDATMLESLRNRLTSSGPGNKG